MLTISAIVIPRLFVFVRMCESVCAFYRFLKYFIKFRMPIRKELVCKMLINGNTTRGQVDEQMLSFASHEYAFYS